MEAVKTLTSLTIFTEKSLACFVSYMAQLEEWLVLHLPKYVSEAYVFLMETVI